MDLSDRFQELLENALLFIPNLIVDSTEKGPSPLIGGGNWPKKHRF